MGPSACFAIAAYLDGTLIRRFRVDQRDLALMWWHRVARYGDKSCGVPVESAHLLTLDYVRSETYEEAIPDISMRQRGSDPEVVYGRLPKPPHLSRGSVL